MTEHSSLNTLQALEQQPVSLQIWVITAACKCGHIFTAVGETYNIAYRILERDLAQHARAL